MTDTVQRNVSVEIAGEEFLVYSAEITTERVEEYDGSDVVDVNIKIEGEPVHKETGLKFWSYWDKFKSGKW